MNARYLTATLRIPVRISLEGDVTLLNEYAQISVGEMDGWKPTKTNETIYSKVIQYLSAEEDDELGKVCEKMEEELGKKEKEEKEETKEEEEIKEEETKEEEKKEEPQIVMHEFSYFKKSKKPLNATFRARIKSQNFTKKVYGW